MLESKILLTGGSGRLGTELMKYFKGYDIVAPSSTNLDITDIVTFPSFKPNVIIHCAAYTDVAKAETDKVKCFNVNVHGTENLVTMFPDAYFVYISSEYAVKPVNFYSLTKQMAEAVVTNNTPNHLIIRTLFKENPYPYEYAFFDQFTNGDYVDIIAPMISGLIINRIIGVHNVGTGRKSLFELARRTKPDIKAISVDDIKDVRLPKEASYYD